MTLVVTTPHFIITDSVVDCCGTYFIGEKISQPHFDDLPLDYKGKKVYYVGIGDGTRPHGAVIPILKCLQSKEFLLTDPHRYLGDNDVLVICYDGRIYSISSNGVICPTKGIGAFGSLQSNFYEELAKYSFFIDNCDQDDFDLIAKIAIKSIATAYSFLRPDYHKIESLFAATSLPG